MMMERQDLAVTFASLNDPVYDERSSTGSLRGSDGQRTRRAVPDFSPGGVEAHQGTRDGGSRLAAQRSSDASGASGGIIYSPVPPIGSRHTEVASITSVCPQVDRSD